MTDRHPIIRLSEVTMVNDRRTVLEAVDLTVHAGDFIAITGPNGGGKTTLLRIILKLLKPTRGTVEYIDSDGRTTDRLAIGYLPQKSAIDSRFPITVRDVVELGVMSATGMSRAERKESVDGMIDLVGLSSHADATLGNLSGGQLQRALLARAIISRPAVLVLDEPLSYVDRRFERRIYDIVESLARESTILLVSHDMSIIAQMANRHLIVDRQHVEFCHSGSHFMHYECCDGHND